MPFDKCSTHTLTLAISAALLTTYCHAESTSADAEMAWSCTQTKDGDWQCDVNEDLVKQAESPADTEPTRQNDASADSETVSVETAEPATPLPQKSITSRPDQAAPKTAQPVAQTTAGQEWQCQGSSDGNWDCSQQSIPQLITAATAGQKDGLSSPSYITANPYADMDWVYYQNAEQLVCPGRYLEPTFPVMGDEALAEPPLHVDAAQSSTELGGLTQLQGGVNMRQGNKRISASYAELDQVTNKTRLEGDVRYREPGMLILGDSAQFDTGTSEGIFSNARYVLHQQNLRGSADRVLHLADGRLRFEQGTYTYCPPYSEAWMIQADSIMVDQEEGFGTARDAVLRIGDVPVFYTPYISFPIDDRRKSGFLYPTGGYDSENGLDLAVPYYFNIAPNMDDTLIPRLLSKRGLMLENEFRYLNQWSYNTLSTSFLADDETGDNRWLLGITHEGKPGPRWRSEIDYRSVSDIDYFDELDTNLDVNYDIHLDQRADLSYQTDDWKILARVHEYQTLEDDTRSPYEKLPQLLLTGRYQLPADVLLNYEAEYVNFRRDLDGLTGSERVIGERRFLMPSLGYEWHAPWAYIKPQLRLWNSSYSLKNQITGLDEKPTVSVPVTSIDSGIFLERDLKNGGIQTLEPRLFLLYVPDEEQSDIPRFDTSLLDFNYSRLFRYNRFSGHDRIGDAQQASLGISSRFLSGNGAELFSASIGQAYYFDDRDVGPGSPNEDPLRDQSDIATNLGWQLTPNMRLSLDAILDQSDFNNTESNVRLRYSSDLDHRFDISYRFEETVREQTDLSFIWPLASHWTSFGRWLHDLQNSDVLEAVLGLEYESCCWKLSFAGRRWLDEDDTYNTGAFMTLTLKGLGALGSGGNAFLEDIIGYEEREEHHDKQAP